MSGESVPVGEAWSAVMADVLAVRKDDRNQAQGFNFRGVDAVMNAVGPALRKHGVHVRPVGTTTHYRDVEVGKNRTPQRECTVTVRYAIRGPAGDEMDGEACAEALDSGDKATSKAMSVAYRTFLLQALTIPTDEPDPDTHSVERSAPARALLHPDAVARFVKACEEAGVDYEQVVDRATEGRTMNPAEVYADEAQALRDAKASLTAAVEPPALVPQ